MDLQADIMNLIRRCYSKFFYLLIDMMRTSIRSDIEWIKIQYGELINTFLYNIDLLVRVFSIHYVNPYIFDV